MPAYAFINGRFSPIEESFVHIEDRGYQFGDGIYEQIRIYNSTPFLLEEHLERLQASAEAIELRLPYTAQEVIAVASKLVKLAGYAEAKLYIQATRGVAPRQHNFPEAAKPTFLMTLREAKPFNNPLKAGKAFTYPDIRWKFCRIKSTNLLPNALAKQEAIKNNAQEAIFVREGDIISEGSSSNVLMIVGDRLLTHPADDTILHGITRKHVLNLAHELKMTVAEQPFTLGELLNADEAFITGTGAEITAIVAVNGQVIGQGIPGTFTGSIFNSYLALVKKTCGM